MVRSVKVASRTLGKQYVAALKKYLGGGKESAVRRAGQMVRQALRNGLGATEILRAHHKALAEVLVPRSEALALNAAGKFLVQCLTPFEVTLRSLSEDHYRRLFERNVAGIFRSTPAGQILDCNEAFARMLGCASRDEVMAHRAWDFYFHRRNRHAKLDLLRKRKALTNYEVCLRRKDGTPLWALVNENLLEVENGQFGVLEGTLIDISQRKRAEEALRRLNEALENQATRIAHELHDEAGQLVTSIYVALNAVAQDVSGPVRKRLQAVMRLLDQIEIRQRRLCHELRPTILDDVGLVPALEFLAKSISARASICASVESSLNGRLPSSIETALYRVVQEGLTNASKHARAGRVTVRLGREANSIRCSVEDNGSGFDAGSVLSKRGRRGLGLMGMRQRVEALNGSFTINSKPGRGTELAITVPSEVKDANNRPHRRRPRHCPPGLKSAIGTGGS